MTKKVEISRDEAELMVELLMFASSHSLAHCVDDLDKKIRQQFGMVSREQELQFVKNSMDG